MRYLRYPLLLLFGALATTAASAQSFDRDIRIVDGPANKRQSAPQVKFGPSGAMYLAWTDYRGGTDGQVYIASSTDGGATFSPGRPMTSSQGIQSGMQRGAQFVVDALGNIHVVWQERNSRYKISARYARSTDGGATFSTPIAVAADGGRQNQDFPSVAADSSGNVYLTWIDDRETGHTQLYFTRSLDGGVTFETPKRAGTMPDGGGSCECCNTAIAVSPEGNVYISFRSNIDNKRDIWIARSLDRGATFTVHQAASENWIINACPMTGSSIVLDASETAHVVWRDSRASAGDNDYIYYTTLRKNESTCAPDKRISDSPRRSNYPSLAVGSDGLIFCAFQDNRNDASDVYYVTSRDGGATFTLGEKLSNEQGDSKQELPSVAIAPSGTVVVAWQDDALDAGDIMLGISSPPAGTRESASRASSMIGLRPQIINASRSSIGYSLTRAASARISLVDALGREVAVLADGYASAGEHRLSVDGLDLASGVYACVVRAGSQHVSAAVLVQR